MFNTYITCPERFYQRYILGNKRPPGFALGMGLTMHDLMELWGNRHMDGRPLPMAEVQQTLLDRWKRRMEDVPDKEAKDLRLRDAKIKDFLRIYAEWITKHQRMKLGKLQSIEEGYGYDGSISFGGVRIAGHLDALWETGPADYKVCGSRSRYRRPDPFSVELAVYCRLAREGVGHKGGVGIITPMIHDWEPAKRGKHAGQYVDSKGNPRQWVEKWEAPQHPNVVQVVEERVHLIVEAINKGQFPSTISKIGAELCVPKFCGYFGTTCRVCGHLERSRYE
jgi:hypothetical protein